MADEQGPFSKNKIYKMRMEKEGLESILVLGDGSLHGFLGCFARRYFGHYGLGNLLDNEEI